MKKKLLLPLLAALLMAPWPIAYAYDSANAANLPVTISPANVSAAPQLQAFGHAIGSVSQGDLFRVDTTAIAADALFSLFLTNTEDLVKCYRYMNLNIGVYVQTEPGQWQKITSSGDIYLTLQGGFVSFNLTGDAVYKITIDNGCFYCYGANPEGNIAVPTFNLAAS
jgi:hypothetical protein